MRLIKGAILTKLFLNEIQKEQKQALTHITLVLDSISNSIFTFTFLTNSLKKMYLGLRNDLFK